VEGARGQALSGLSDPCGTTVLLSHVTPFVFSVIATLPTLTPLFQYWGCVDSSLARNGRRVKWLSAHADYCHSVPFSGGAINGQTSRDMPLKT